MKRCTTLSLLALCLMLAAVPAIAQTVYSNGPINGNVDGWAINFGFIVSDTFNVSNNATTITGLDFGAHVFPGDILLSVELSITSGENSGTSFFDQTVNFTQSDCHVSEYGFNVCTESSSPFLGPTLNVGTYWLNLQNATTNTGDPAYWDENSGPSQASENTLGSIPSEAFTLLGSSSTTSTTTSTTTSVPEPTSILLLGSGVLGLGGLLRRRLF